VPHVRFQMNVLEEIKSTWKGEQLRGNEHSIRVHFMQHLAPRREHWDRATDRTGTSARKTVCGWSGKAPFTPYLSCRWMNCTHSAMTPGWWLPCQTPTLFRGRWGTCHRRMSI